MRTRVMPWASPGLWLRQAVPARFDFQPAPPGMMASSMEPPCASVSRMRTPLAAGSIGGAVGTAILPFIRSTLLPGTLSFRILIRALVAKTGTMLVHGSHASPMPSWSLSACEGFASVGQSSCTPSQVSARSHTPAAARHTTVLLPSAGHAPLVPSQLSATSHTPAAGRHSTVAGWKVSAGQSALSPSQLSARSHGPAAARHTAVLLASAGHAALVPVQVSAGSHTPAEVRHSTVAASKASAGQSLLSPSQLSATSHEPAAARQTAVLLASP